MTSKEVKQIVDENIGKLFWALLPKIPSMVGDDYLEYTINESVVKSDGERNINSIVKLLFQTN